MQEHSRELKTLVQALSLDGSMVLDGIDGEDFGGSRGRSSWRVSPVEDSPFNSE